MSRPNPTKPSTGTGDGRSGTSSGPTQKGYGGSYPGSGGTQGTGSQRGSQVSGSERDPYYVYDLILISGIIIMEQQSAGTAQTDAQFAQISRFINGPKNPETNKKASEDLQDFDPRTNPFGLRTARLLDDKNKPSKKGN